MGGEHKLITVGKIGSPYGVKGWIKILSFTDPPENIFAYSPWQLRKKQKLQAIQLAAHEPYREGFIVKFKHYDTPETAAFLNGAEIVIERSQLATLDQDDIYWSDLEGLRVINEQNIELGYVSHLFQTASNDVMVVKGNKERIIPFLMGTYIKQVDLGEQLVIVDWDAEF